MDGCETFSFGDGYRLEVGRDGPGRKVLTLFHKDRAIPDLLKPTLELLHYMVLRPREDLLDEDILTALWSTSRRAVVEQHVHYLRVALDEELRDTPYIKTLHGRGYKFMPKVKREGGGVDAYLKWDRARFHTLMRDLKRGPDNDTEDLRIVATGIGATLDEVDIKGLLRKGVRMKILFMNPDNKVLTNARYSLRKDKMPSRCLRELRDQIEDIQGYAKQFPPPPSKQKTANGWIELGLSDIMPCGFLVHTRDWALLGVYPAQDSYTGAPMMEMRSGTEPWEVLNADFNARWDDFLQKRGHAEVIGD